MLKQISWIASQSFVVASSLFLFAAAEQINPATNQLFDSADWRQFGKQSASDVDLLVFKDGTKLLGHLQKIPPLVYPFGTFSFQVKDLSTVMFGEYEGEKKMQVITNSGENFIAERPKGEVLFFHEVAVAQDKSTVGDQSNRERSLKQIDLQDIHYILLKNRTLPPDSLPKKFYHMSLRNGNQLAVALESEEIHLTDGWKSQTISSEHLVDVTFNGGLQGTVEGESSDQSIGFTFVEGATIGVHIAGESIRMPWVQIAKLKRNLGDYVIDKQEATLAELYHTLSSDEEVIYAQLTEELHTTKDMVMIEGGSFVVTATDNLSKKQWDHYQVSDLTQPERPSYYVTLTNFYIDRCAVSNRDYALFTLATGHPTPSHWTDGSIPKGKEDQAVVNVCYDDAQAYASWAGKRLPTEVEWERASNILSEHFLTQELVQEQALPLSSSSPLQSVTPLEANYTEALLEWTTAEMALEHPSMDFQIVRAGFTDSDGFTALRQRVYRKERSQKMGFRCVKEP